jgi:hypothetical protein
MTEQVKNETIELSELGTVRALSAPRRVLQRLSMLWRLFRIDRNGGHLWLSLPAVKDGKVRDRDRAWQEEINALVEAAKSGSDEALCTLVQRDPRYLGSSLVQAKIIEWKLQAIRSRHNSPRLALDLVLFGEEEDHEEKDAPTTGLRHQEKQRRGPQEKLDAIAKSISYTVGSGNDTFISPFLLLNNFNRVHTALERLSEEVRGKRSVPGVDALLKMSGLPSEYGPEMLELRAKLSDVGGATRQVLVRLYGVSRSVINRRLAEANKLQEEQEAELP